MSTDLIARLIEAGTPAALVAEVAMALGEAAADQRAIASRRATDAARQQARREAERASRDITCGHATSRDTADATPTLDKETSPRPPKEINPTPGESSARARKPAWPVPDGVKVEHWRDFLANRKSKRLGFTPTAHRGQLKALTDLSDDDWPPGRLVEHAAARGWGAIHDPRETEHRHDRPFRSSSRPGTRSPDGFASALREIAGPPDSWGADHPG